MGTGSRIRALGAIVVGAVIASLMAFTPSPASAAAPTGSLTGTVTVPEGVQITTQSVRVELYHVEFAERPVAAAWVAADGTYTIADVDVAQYRVHFSADALGLASEYWNGKTDYASAELVTVTEGETTPGIDADLLDPEATIAGRFTIPSNVGGVDINAYSANDPTRPIASTRVWSFSPDYVLHGLPAGSYKVQFTRPGSGYIEHWWQGGTDFEDATVITLAEGEHRTGLDAAVQRGASVSGRIAGGRVSTEHGLAYAYRQDRDGVFQREAGTHVAADGTYTIRGLRAGTYTLSFSSSMAIGYDERHSTVWSEWWKDKPGSAQATSFTLSTNTSLTGVNANLDTVGGASSWPTVTGSSKVGRLLTAAPGVWALGTVLAYQWYADQVAIGGATGPTYRPTAAEVGKRLQVIVYGQTGATWERKSSAVTSKVAVGALTPATPTISGWVAKGSTLTAKAGTWTAGTALSYRWFADGAAIAGATASTYTVAPSLGGARISVAVTGKKAGYATVVMSSRATPKVATVATPTILGTPEVGRTLSAKTGTWTPGTVFTYQWFAAGTPIAGATASTLTLAPAQQGAEIVVKVTGTRSAYATVTKTSAATLPVG